MRQIESAPSLTSRETGLLALHDWFSVNVSRRGLWYARTLLPRTRHDGRHYRAGLRFRRESWEWSNERRREWVLQRLREVVRRAYDTTVYYREAYDRAGFDPRAPFSFADFGALPVLERAIVQERQDDLLSSAVPARERLANATGGSSGRPVHIAMGPAERGWRASGSDFSMERLGVEPGVRRALLWGHHLDPVMRSGILDRVADVAGNRAWFDCLRLSPQRLLSYHEELTRYRPRCLVAYASALALLAETIDRAGLGPASYPTRRIVTGAEKLLQEQREVVERVFRVPVHERYGSRDVGDMGFQYDPRTTLDYRIDWALVLVEPAGSGPESDILVTKLQADAMPMIRYRTDDVGVFPADARTGEPTFVLHEVLGRRADRIFKRDGSWVNGLHFPHLLKDFRLADFRVFQREDHAVEVSVVLTPDSPPDALARIRANIAANVGDLPLTVEPVATLERTKANKWRPVISMVRQAGRND